MNKLNTLKQRSLIISYVREFFFKNGYIEVETPIRLPSIIPEDHIDPFQSENYFLQSSPEICMKRLLSRGHKKIFQICKSFRKGERGSIHIPEMTMLEWYNADKNYFDLMAETEDLIKFTAEKLNIEHISRNNEKTDLISPFEKISVAEAIKKYTKYTLSEADENFDEIFGLQICPFLGLKKPVFLYNFPRSQASLAKLCENDNRFAQRFELFISGVEICNCFTELTDPEEQKKRFLKTIKFRKKYKKTTSPLPEKFLEDLRSMPDSSGNALGLDRLIMLLLNKNKIDEILAFSPEEL